MICSSLRSNTRNLLLIISLKYIDDFPFKVQFDKKVIHSALERNSENEANGLKTHFVFTVGASSDIYFHNADRLRLLILEGMQQLKIKTVMVTILHMERVRLISNEAAESFFNGKMFEKNSVNDDLQLFYRKLRLGQETDEEVKTYFLPKLTEKELKLARKKDQTYFKTFSRFNSPFFNPNEQIAGMKNEFVRGVCERRTFTIETTSGIDFR